MLAACAACADALHAFVDDGLQHLSNLPLVAGDDLGDVELTSRHFLCNLLWLQPRLDHGIGDEEEGALAEYTFILQGFHHDIGQRHLILVDAIDAHQSAERALHGHRRVLFHKLLNVFGDAFCQTSGVFHFFKI